MLFLDKCHLVWGDISGYGWSRRNQCVDVPVQSIRERQTYDGALDYLPKNFRATHLQTFLFAKAFMYGYCSFSI